MYKRSKSVADNDKSTIAISNETKALLDKLGNKGDTYEDIIKRLIMANTVRA
jgi:hypothetical protein